MPHQLDLNFHDKFLRGTWCCLIPLCPQCNFFENWSQSFVSLPMPFQLSLCPGWILCCHFCVHSIFTGSRFYLFAPVSSSSSGIKFAMKYSSVTFSGFNSNSSSLPVYTTEILNSSKSSLRTGINFPQTPDAILTAHESQMWFFENTISFIYLLYLSE